MRQVDLGAEFVDNTVMGDLINKKLLNQQSRTKAKI